MASKSKKRRRVLGASCILAALIIAGSSFAWFTSKDEVTNRLSASSDYDVKIVESFAPPKNWLPGQDVDKDTYSTNTGTIAAFVRNDVSGVLTITKEENVTEGVTWDKGVATLDTSKVDYGNLVTLKEDEVYSIEAGSYLAYAPNGSNNEVGRQIVAYPPTAGAQTTIYRKNASGGAGDPDTIDQAAYDLLDDAGKAKYDAVVVTAAKTDFTPTTNGLYVFRRTIDVDRDALETFTYDAYYFNDGVYYKVTDLKVTSDDANNTLTGDNALATLDAAGDGKENDGLLSAAEATFLRDKTEVIEQPTSFTYDAENNRLIATYGADDRDVKLSAYETAAKALDKAEHELAEARVALDKAIRNKEKSGELVDYWTNVVAQLNAEITAVQNRMDAIGDPSSPDNDTILKNLNTQKTNLESKRDQAETDAKAALAALYGATNNNFDTTTGAFEYNPEATTSAAAVSGSKLYDLLKAKEDVVAARAADQYAESMFEAYVNELETKFGTTFTSYDDVLNKLTYAQLSNSDLDYSLSPELHNIHQLTVEVAKAKKAYDDKKKEANDNIAEYLKAVNDLGLAGTKENATEDTTEYIGGQEIKYTAQEVSGESGVLGAISRAEAEYETLSRKLTKLNDALSTAAGKAIESQSVETGHDAATDLTTALSNYQAKALAYDQAYAANELAKKAYENGNSIKIYINLSDDVVTTGGVADKWQLSKPTTLDDFYSPANATVPTSDTIADTAVFYYTSILEGGETSAKLIDSVELDSGVTKDMYKYFDYDLNVALKSAQATYDTDNETILTKSAVDELKATPTLSNNKDINTAITWAAP